MNFQSGLLDKSRMVSNLLLVILVAGNIYLGIQYTETIRRETAQQDQDTTKIDTRIQISRFLRFFIDTVLNTKGTISFDDRVKLENDIRQIKDADLTKSWDNFVASKDGKVAQVNAVKLMSLLSAKLL